MTKYAKELYRRIRSGEPVEVTRTWWLTWLAEDPTPSLYKDLSKVEKEFMDKMIAAYEAWRQETVAFERWRNNGRLKH